MKMTPYQSPIFAPKKFDAERKSAEKGCAEVGVPAEKNSSAKKRSPMLLLLQQVVVVVVVVVVVAVAAVASLLSQQVREA